MTIIVLLPLEFILDLVMMNVREAQMLMELMSRRKIVERLHRTKESLWKTLHTLSVCSTTSAFILMVCFYRWQNRCVLNEAQTYQ